MAELHAEARIPLADPPAAIAAFAARFADQADVARTADGATVESPRLGRMALSAAPGVLVISCTCPTASALSFAKMAAADALQRLAGEEGPAFAWSGAGAAGGPLPFFRELVVARAFQVSPGMRRIVLAGDAAHYDTASLHVRVLIPPPGRAPVWPHADAMGRMVWPQGADALVPRVYTVRQVDLARGEIAIDVALHGDPDAPAGPGATWARTAAPGARVGLLGPGGAPFVPGAFNLLAGDATALPAIARILERLPADARALALIEVDDGREEQPLVSPATLDVRWLHRAGAPAGTTSMIEAAVRDVVLPVERATVRVFAGCEQGAAWRLRAHLIDGRGLDKRQVSVAAYWRRGHEGVDIGD
ncbi:siderophore-interacting protein [Xanthobacter pseudotagetidis]|uniref:siderophore-interacting protein n=1 Tax=Xanthobacter pseudotagetidis TaxID=3119911 RepID=UPI00372B113F